MRAELLDTIAQVERNLGLLEPAARRADRARAAPGGERRLRLELAASLVTRAEIHFDQASSNRR